MLGKISADEESQNVDFGTDGKAGQECSRHQHADLMGEGEKRHCKGEQTKNAHQNFGGFHVIQRGTDKPASQYYGDPDSCSDAGTRPIR